MSKRDWLKHIEFTTAAAIAEVKIKTMTQSNELSIEQMNEAIAIFDGLTKHDDDRYAYPHFKNSKGDFVGYAHNIGYDTDWNMLMSVCHKIREKAFELRSNERAALLLSKLNIQLMYGIRADVHCKAFDFITWYNQQTTTNDQL